MAKVLELATEIDALMGEVSDDRGVTAFHVREALIEGETEMIRKMLQGVVNSGSLAEEANELLEELADFERMTA